MFILTFKFPSNFAIMLLLDPVSFWFLNTGDSVCNSPEVYKTKNILCFSRHYFLGWEIKKLRYVIAESGLVNRIFKEFNLSYTKRYRCRLSTQRNWKVSKLAIAYRSRIVLIQYGQALSKYYGSS